MQIFSNITAVMWFVMESVQRSYTLSERLLHAIGASQNALQDRENVEDLIKQGADVNQAHGTLLPLHCACMVNNVQCVKILLKMGAEVNAYDGCHRTALHHASEHSAECVRALLQSGADTEALDINHNTALHWAAFRNKWECVKLLLENGANVNAVDYNNDTPVSWAAMKGNLESVRILLNHNASVDIGNYNGLMPFARIAILLATGLNSSDDDLCFELLLRASGKIDIRDQSGNLPGIIARDQRLADQLMALCSSPRSLFELCRFAIRKNLPQCHIPSVIVHLPVPDRLHSFLLLEE